MNKLLQIKFIHWFGWLVFSLSFLWLILFVLTGEQINIVRWVSYVLPWLVMLLLLAGIVELLVGKRLVSACLLVIGAYLSIPYIPLFIPSNLAIPEGQTVYKVMTYSKMGRNRDIEAVADVILSERPDILLMQEISVEDAEKLVHLLVNIYNGEPIYYLADEYDGLIFSRYKVTNRYDKSDASMSAEIAISDKTVIAWNVHLQKSINKTDIQYRMIKNLVEQVASTDGPIIVAGDFNATEINQPYFMIKQYLDNTHEQSGFGFGFTFPAPARRIGSFIPFMRIDHIFVSKEFNTHNSTVSGNAGGSDHFPVLATLSLKTPAESN